MRGYTWTPIGALSYRLLLRNSCMMEESGKIGMPASRESAKEGPGTDRRRTRLRSQLSRGFENNTNAAVNRYRPVDQEIMRWQPTKV
jgi:hypothetical protein